jgi:hypothetical protein
MFKYILSNLPLFGKVFSGVSIFILGIYKLWIDTEHKDFEKAKSIKAKKVESDNLLFSEFKKVLSSSIEHIQNNKKSSHFPENGLREFSNFCYDWNDSKHQFVDVKVEQEKEELRNLICKFKDFILSNMDLKGGNYVLSQMKNHLELDAIRKEMENQSIKVFESYEHFILNTNRCLHKIV